MSLNDRIKGEYYRAPMTKLASRVNVTNEINSLVDHYYGLIKLLDTTFVKVTLTRARIIPTLKKIRDKLVQLKTIMLTYGTMLDDKLDRKLNEMLMHFDDYISSNVETIDIDFFNYGGHFDGGQIPDWETKKGFSRYLSSIDSIPSDFGIHWYGGKITDDRFMTVFKNAFILSKKSNMNATVINNSMIFEIFVYTGDRMLWLEFGRVGKDLCLIPKYADDYYGNLDIVMKKDRSLNRYTTEDIFPADFELFIKGLVDNVSTIHKDMYIKIKTNIPINSITGRQQYTLESVRGEDKSRVLVNDIFSHSDTFNNYTLLNNNFASRFYGLTKLNEYLKYNYKYSVRSSKNYDEFAVNYEDDLISEDPADKNFNRVQTLYNFELEPSSLSVINNRYIRIINNMNSQLQYFDEYADYGTLITIRNNMLSSSSKIYHGKSVNESPYKFISQNELTYFNTDPLRDYKNLGDMTYTKAKYPYPVYYNDYLDQRHSFSILGSDKIVDDTVVNRHGGKTSYKESILPNYRLKEPILVDRFGYTISNTEHLGYGYFYRWVEQNKLTDPGFAAVFAGGDITKLPNHDVSALALYNRYINTLSLNIPVFNNITPTLNYMNQNIGAPEIGFSNKKTKLTPVTNHTDFGPNSDNMVAHNHNVYHNGNIYPFNSIFDFINITDSTPEYQSYNTTNQSAFKQFDVDRTFIKSIYINRLDTPTSTKQNDLMIFDHNSKELQLVKRQESNPRMIASQTQVVTKLNGDTVRNEQYLDIKDMRFHLIGKEYPTLYASTLDNTSYYYEMVGNVPTITFDNNDDLFNDANKTQYGTTGGTLDVNGCKIVCLDTIDEAISYFKNTTDATSVRSFIHATTIYDYLNNTIYYVCRPMGYATQPNREFIKDIAIYNGWVCVLSTDNIVYLINLDSKEVKIYEFEKVSRGFITSEANIDEGLYNRFLKTESCLMVSILGMDAVKTYVIPETMTKHMFKI